MGGLAREFGQACLNFIYSLANNCRLEVAESPPPHWFLANGKSTHKFWIRTVDFFQHANCALAF